MNHQDIPALAESPPTDTSPSTDDQIALELFDSQLNEILEIAEAIEDGRLQATKGVSAQLPKPHAPHVSDLASGREEMPPNTAPDTDDQMKKPACGREPSQFDSGSDTCKSCQSLDACFGSELYFILKELEDDIPAETSSSLRESASEVITKAMKSSKPGSESTSEGALPITGGAVIPITSLPLIPVKPILTADDLNEDYSFPDILEGDLSALSNEALAESIEDIVATMKSPDDYIGIRDQYCATSIEFNLRGLWAPAYRPGIHIPLNSKERKAIHMVLHRDRIVIDCHWIHSKSMIVHTERAWRPIFKHAGEFPFSLAEEFASRHMASDYRAETVLGLTIRQQLQMLALKGYEVSARNKAIVKHERGTDGKLIHSQLKAATAEIDRWCEIQPKVRKHRGKYVAHAKAYLLLLAASKPIWREVAELGGLIQGVKPLGDKTVMDFMKKLDQRMEKAKLTSPP